MNKISQQKELIFISFILLALLIILCSFSLPESNSIICKEGLLSVHIENMILEDFGKKLADGCNINIFIDDKAKGFALNADFESYPIPYGISKVLEGTGFNFVIFKDELAEKSWTIYIGPTKGVSGQPSLSSISGQSSSSYSSSYSSPPQYNYSPPIQEQNTYKSEAKRVESNPSSSYQSDIHSYYAPIYQQTPTSNPGNIMKKNIEIPTAGSDIKSNPSINQRQIYSPPDRTRRQISPHKPQMPTPTPMPPPPPSNPPPPNTGSG